MTDKPSKAEQQKQDDLVSALNAFRTIPGGVSASALSGSLGVSESEATRRLEKLADDGKLTAVDPMQGERTYFLASGGADEPRLPAGGAPDEGSIDHRDDLGPTGDPDKDAPEPTHDGK